MIIETCPKCGYDLINMQIDTFPPIPRKECTNCDWHWEGEPEQVMRIPFVGNSFSDTKTTVFKNNNCYIDTTIITLNDLNKEDVTINSFSQSACENCLNNPKNGGSGICLCTLGQQVTY